MTVELRPFHIGRIRIDLPFTLAPMAGYSDHPYRLICRQFGAPYCTTEMMLDRLLLTKGRMRNRLLKLSEEDHPIAGQLIGNDPAVMAEAAKELCRMGFDAVDLNFACPVRKALSRRRGGHLLTEPDQAVRITRAVVASVREVWPGTPAPPVTVKLRQKFDQADGEDAFWRIAEGAFQAGAAAVCVHARSVERKYAGPADWEFLAAVKRRLPDMTIIGSGDVLTPAQGLRMLAETGVDAVAVARGALGNPWFFQQVRELAAGREPHQPSLAEQRDVLTRHFAGACELYGPEKGPRIMRKFGIKYARMHPHPKQMRIAFVAVKRPEHWQAVLDEHYRDGP